MTQTIALLYNNILETRFTMKILKYEESIYKKKMHPCIIKNNVHKKAKNIMSYHQHTFLEYPSKPPKITMLYLLREEQKL